jgi:hypothetical protein
MKAFRLMLLVSALAVPAGATAAPLTFAGNVDDEGSLTINGGPAGANGALVSYLLGAPETTPPDFADRNVALFVFSLTSDTALEIDSQGYGMGGFDSIVTIFRGSGLGALFEAEFFNNVLPGDFQATTGVLGAGSYVLAISMFNNLSCGVGGCTGSTGLLGDGFTGLSNFDPFAPAPYFFQVVLGAVRGGTDPIPGTPAPEPTTMALMVAGAAMLARRRCAQRR